MRLALFILGLHNKQNKNLNEIKIYHVINVLICLKASYWIAFQLTTQLWRATGHREQQKSITYIKLFSLFVFPWENEIENGWRFPEHHVREPETCLHVRAQSELEGHTTATCQDTGVQCCPGAQEMRNNTRMPPISLYFQRCLIINALCIIPLWHRYLFNCMLSVLLCLYQLGLTTSTETPQPRKFPRYVSGVIAVNTVGFWGRMLWGISAEEQVSGGWFSPGLRVPDIYSEAETISCCFSARNRN